MAHDGDATVNQQNQNLPRYRAGQVLRTGKASLTNSETTELRRLFDLVADTCDVAGMVLGRAGPPPIGSNMGRLRELSDRIDAMAERIKSILGDGADDESRL